MTAANKRMTAWKPIGIIAVKIDGRRRTFRTGDVCKREGKSGQFRIIGIDQHRSGIVDLVVRHEKSGRQYRFDIEEAVYVKPPYKVVT